MNTFLKAFLTVVTLTALVACGVQPDGQRNDEQNAFSRSAVSVSVLPGVGAAPEAGCSCEEIEDVLSSVLDSGQDASFGPGRGPEHVTMCGTDRLDEWVEKFKAETAATKAKEKAATAAEKKLIQAAELAKGNCSPAQKKILAQTLNKAAQARTEAEMAKVGLKATMMRLAGGCANTALKVAAFGVRRGVPFAEVMLSASTCQGAESHSRDYLSCSNVDGLMIEEGKVLEDLIRESNSAKKALMKLEKRLVQEKKQPPPSRMEPPWKKTEREIKETLMLIAGLNFEIYDATRAIEMYKLFREENCSESPTPTITPTPAPTSIELPIPPKRTTLSSPSTQVR